MNEPESVLCMEADRLRMACRSLNLPKLLAEPDILRITVTIIFKKQSLLKLYYILCFTFGDKITCDTGFNKYYKT